LTWSGCGNTYAWSFQKLATSHIHGCDDDSDFSLYSFTRKPPGIPGYIDPAELKFI